MAEQIFFADGGKVPLRVIFQLESEDALEPRIYGVSHRSEYGGGKQRNELPRVIDGICLALL